MGILQATILEWVVMPSSRGSSWLRDRTQISCITGRFFAVWATCFIKILFKNIFYHSNHICKKQCTRVYNETMVYCPISPSPNSISQEESLLLLFQGFLMVISLILKNEPSLLFLDLLVNHCIKMRRFVPLFFHVFSSVSSACFLYLYLYF